MIIFGLFGKTGCGKTEILQELKKYHPVVDIEECGNTRGSVLGDLYHLKQHSQEVFEKLLKEQVKTAEEKGYCIVEFEGRKIGGTEKLDIPEPFSNLKYYNYNIIIECPYECQIQRLLKYYLPKNDREKEILISKFKTLKTLLKKPEKLEPMTLPTTLKRLFDVAEDIEFFCIQKCRDCYIAKGADITSYKGGVELGNNLEVFIVDKNNFSEKPDDLSKVISAIDAQINGIF